MSRWRGRAVNTRGVLNNIRAAARRTSRHASGVSCLGMLIAWMVCHCLAAGSAFAAANDSEAALRFIKQGQTFESQKNYSAAVAAYARAVEAAPTEAAPYVLLGWAAHLAGDNATAVAQLDTANVLGPKNAKTLLRLGLVQRDLRQWSQAVNTLREATQLDPKSAQAPNALAGCLYQTGDYAGAAAAFTTAIERAPNDPELFRQRAVAFEKLERRKQALADVERAAGLATTEQQKQDISAVRQRLTAIDVAPSRTPENGIGSALVKSQPPDPAVERAVQRSAAIRPTLVTPVARQIDFAVLSGERYAAAVSGAQELLKLVLGPRTAEENARAEAAWAAAFDFPAPEVVTYLNALNPLLAQFVSLRANTALLLDQFHETWTEAMLAAAYGNRSAAEAIMAQCRAYQEHLRTTQADLKKVMAAIEALGDMPDPAVAKRRARKAADLAISYIEDGAEDALWERLHATTSLAYRLVGDISTHSKGTRFQRDPAKPYLLNLNPLDESEAVKDTTITQSWTSKDIHIPLEWRGREFFGSLKHTDSGSWPQLNECTAWGRISEDARRLQFLYVIYTQTGVREPNNSTSIAQNRSMTSVSGFSVRDLPQIDESLAVSRPPVSYSVIDIPGRKPSASEALQQFVATRREQRFSGERTADETFVIAQARVKSIEVRFLQPLRDVPDPEGPPALGSPADVQGFFNSSHPWATLLGSTAQAAVAQDKLEKFAAFVRDLSRADAEERRREEARRAQIDGENLAAQTATYQRDIVAIEKFLGGVQDDLARARAANSSDKTLRDLESQIRMQQSEIQSRRDLIQSLQTGTLVHTRTPFDDYCRGQAILQARDDVARLTAVDREQRTQKFMLAKLDPSQRGEIQRSTNEMLKAGGGMDPVKWREVNKLAYKRYQGTLGAEKDKADATTEMWDNRVWGAEATATAADIAFSLLSGTGGYKTAGLVYSFTTSALNNGLDKYFQTGSKQEGLKRGLFEGTKSVVTGLDDRIDYACTATEAFYAEPKASYQDRLQAAATAAGEKWLTNKATGFIADALARKINLEQPRSGWKPTGAQAIQAAQFQREMEFDEGLARDFLATHRQWRTAALRRDLPAEELARLAAETRRKACSVNSRYGAKVFMKYSALPVEQRAFSSVMDEIHAGLIPQFQQRMAAGGTIDGKPIGQWGDFNVFPIRNASSAGTASIDFDLGLRQQPDWLPDGAGGRRRNVWLTRDGQPASPHEFSEIAQPVWEQLYREHTGYSAVSAFENITTLQHKEAYKDMAWINITKKGGVDAIDPRWAQQAGDVTRVKHYEMTDQQPSLLHYQKLQESCRGTAKDINTKVFTQLADIEKKRGAKMTATQREHFNEVKTYWTRCQQVMADFGQGRMSPLEADRQIYLLSGGRGIEDLTDRVGTAIEGLGKGKKN